MNALEIIVVAAAIGVTVLAIGRWRAARKLRRELERRFYAKD